MASSQKQQKTASARGKRVALDLKNAYDLAPVLPDEPQTINTWGANLPEEVRTRSQARSMEDTSQTAPGLTSRTTSMEGKPSKKTKSRKVVDQSLDRSKTDGDRQKMGLKTPITDFKTLSRKVSYDRPAEAGGDRKPEGSSVRPEETGGERTETETKGSEAETGDDQEEVPEPIGATQATEVVEEVITGEDPEMTRVTQEDQNATQAGDETVLIAAETTIPIIPLVETENTTPVVNTSDASIEEIDNLLNASPESTPRKTQKSDQEDQKKNPPREFLKEKSKPEDAKGPPLWREFKKAKSWGIPRARRYKGYSDVDIESMWKYTRKHDDMYEVEVESEYTLSDAQYKWRGTTLDIKMPPKPEEPEPILEPEPIAEPEPGPLIRVNAGVLPRFCPVSPHSDIGN